MNKMVAQVKYDRILGAPIGQQINILLSSSLRGIFRSGTILGCPALRSRTKEELIRLNVQPFREWTVSQSTNYHCEVNKHEAQMS